ncbi:MAG: cytochrome bd-I ubiquinol oxidase subunit 2 apoprotein [Holophagaceae bacterium]|nr:cytochrome bd-I ubiquinol oxidase subunit 2 apoprotein [Holophagaceae bacterium]
MAELWFWLVSVMVAIYSVMDGFDFGAGALHLFVAKSDTERREVLGAIGPLWDGNEVWLLAGGGAMFLAFPKILASGFSGFYLAMFLVVWTLILRGISIEFRSHVQDGLWRAFWDGVFALASILMPVLLGAALGNVLRGVPVDGTGYFNIPLFTHFGVSNPVGILDWFTVLIGVFSLVTISAHGALFLAWKTEGQVHERSKGLAAILWWLVVALWLVSTLATRAVNPRIFAAFPHAPLAWLFFIVYLAGLVLVFTGMRKGRFLQAFLGSGAFILGILATSAACVWPVMLRSTLDPAHDMTALNSSASYHSMSSGLGWWFIGFIIVLGYLVNLFRIHRGKVKAAADGEGY